MAFAIAQWDEVLGHENQRGHFRFSVVIDQTHPMGTDHNHSCDNNGPCISLVMETQSAPFSRDIRLPIC